MALLSVSGFFGLSGSPWPASGGRGEAVAGKSEALGGKGEALGGTGEVLGGKGSGLLRASALGGLSGVGSSKLGAWRLGIWELGGWLLATGIWPNALCPALIASGSTGVCIVLVGSVLGREKLGIRRAPLPPCCRLTDGGGFRMKCHRLAPRPSRLYVFPGSEAI